MEVPGDNPSNILLIPQGYRVVYTLEDQPNLGRCKHVSVSVYTEKDSGALPSPAAVTAILELLGMHSNLAEQEDVKVSKYAEGFSCIEVLQTY